VEAVWTVILHHIPEACLVYWVGLGLVGAKLPLRRVAPVAGAIGISVYFFRTFLFPWHVPALMVVQAIVQRFFFRVSWHTSLASVFISFILLNVGEAVLALIVFPTLMLSLDDVFMSPLLSLVMGWTSLLPLALASLAVYRLGWVLIPLHADSQRQRHDVDGVSSSG
jgi:hypothetical protein